MRRNLASNSSAAVNAVLADPLNPMFVSLRDAEETLAVIQDSVHMYRDLALSELLSFRSRASIGKTLVSLGVYLEGLERPANKKRVIEPRHVVIERERRKRRANGTKGP